jgi:hypothetical protein
MTSNLISPRTFVESLLPDQELRRLKLKPIRLEEKIDILSFVLALRRQQDQGLADALRRVAAQLRESGDALPRLPETSPAVAFPSDAETRPLPAKSFFTNSPRVSIGVSAADASETDIFPKIVAVFSAMKKFAS